MSFARTETQTMLADMADRLLGEANSFEDRRKRLQGDTPDRMALWPIMAEQGLIGAAFTESAGGFGGTMRDLATLMEPVGRHLVVEPMLASATCGALLHAAGDDVSEVIAGGRILAFAHEEGLDPFALRRTQATLRDGEWRVTGRKLAVRHGDLAHALIVTASADDETICFVIDADAAGISKETTRMMDGASAATLEFDRVPARRLNLSPDDLIDVLNRTSVALASEAVAILEIVCDKTFAYLKTRKQFGLPLASFQALQHRAADMVAARESARVMTDQAINAIEEDEDAGAFAAAAKALADDAGLLIGHEAVQMHGGMGVSDELDISHYMRRLAVIRATLGQAPVHRQRFASFDLETRYEGKGDLASFRAEVRTFVRDYLPLDIAAKGDANLKFGKDDHVRWQKVLREKGWFAAAWPREHGGAGWDLKRQLAFVQETGLAGAPLVIPYGVNMVGPVLQEFGSSDQCTRHLPGILSSDVWWCQGYSEPNAGSDLASLKTSAVREGNDYVVNGTKMWTTEAHWADWMHCLVRTDREGKPQAGISFLLIDMTTPGIEIRPIMTIDGQHHTNQIFLDDVRVPAGNLVGVEGQGWEIAKFLLANERVAIADTGPKLRLLADIKRLFAEMKELEGQVQPMQLLGDRLTDAEIQLTALCAMEQDYVQRWSLGETRNGPEASILKVRGTEILQLLTEIALVIEGPLGGIHEPCDLHLSSGVKLSPSQRASTMAHQYLYGRCWSIFGGTNEIQRGLIARAVLG